MSIAMYFIRVWCHDCKAWTTHRRRGRMEDPSAKVSCAEHNEPIRRVDWVDAAIKMSAVDKENKMPVPW